jgi:hypothetical protein
MRTIAILKTIIDFIAKLSVILFVICVIVCPISFMIEGIANVCHWEQVATILGQISMISGVTLCVLLVLSFFFREW